VVGQVLARLRFRHELLTRNLLAVLYDLSEPGLPGRPALAFDRILQRKSWDAGRLRRLLAAAGRAGHVEGSAGDGYRLTERGLARAAEVARGHRLWELYLTEYPDQATGLANLAEESVEALLPAEIVADLTRKLRQAGRYPSVSTTD
jgi:hypothetical protein